MDTNWFDILTKSVSRPGTRRRLVHLVVALPAASLVAGLLAAEHAGGQGNGAGVSGGGGRRRRRVRHHPGQDKNNRKSHGKKACAKAGQTPKTGKRKACCSGLVTDASRRCAGPEPVPCTGLTPTATSPTQGLQEAIDAAEAGATLTLCAGTWHLTSTVTVEISKDLTLVGAGAGKTVLDGGNAVRVLSVETGSIVTLQDLMITKGSSLYGGGIFNGGTLTLEGVSVTANTAIDYGGGILNGHKLALIRVSVSGNTVTRNGGGIYNSGPLTLNEVSVTGNTAGNDGGGIYTRDVTVTLPTGNSVTGNSAMQRGGGIYQRDGFLTLQTGSSVTGNTAAEGGGIFNNQSMVILEGNEDPSPIVVNNCQDNCGGDPVARCAPLPVSCPGR